MAVWNPHWIIYSRYEPMVDTLIVIQIRMCSSRSWIPIICHDVIYGCLLYFLLLLLLLLLLILAIFAVFSLSHSSRCLLGTLTNSMEEATEATGAKCQNAVPSTPVSDRGSPSERARERASKGGELISKLHHNAQLIEFAMQRAHANNFVFRLFVRLVL